MSKASKNKKAQPKKRILATKKAASAVKQNQPLTFQKISESELNESRNSAYAYLIK
jgi:hypothetical protein